MKKLYILILVLFLAGCQTALYSGLTEPEANEVVAALLNSGIDATKSKVDEKNWSVSVATTDMGRAVDTLKQAGVPQERYADIGQLFKKEGLVSTPSEERIRFIFATSQELSSTLTKIDGVLAARVHVVLPANDPLSDKVKPSSAAVFIKHRPEAPVQAMKPKIVDMVAKSIEGLSSDNISLILFPAEASANAVGQVKLTSWLGFMVSDRAFWPLTTVFVLILLLLFGLIGLIYARYRESFIKDWQTLTQRFARGKSV